MRAPVPLEGINYPDAGFQMLLKDKSGLLSLSAFLTFLEFSQTLYYAKSSISVHQIYKGMLWQPRLLCDISVPLVATDGDVSGTVPAVSLSQWVVNANLATRGSARQYTGGLVTGPTKRVTCVLGSRFLSEPAHSKSAMFIFIYGQCWEDLLAYHINKI